MAGRSGRKSFAVWMVAVLSTFLALFALSGCSANDHAVVPDSESCGTCHSGEKPTFDVAEPAGAIAVGPRILLSAPSESLVVAKPIYTADDGSVYVPVLYKTLTLKENPQEVVLEPGAWVIAQDDGDSAKSILLQVDPAITEVVEVELK